MKRSKASLISNKKLIITSCLLLLILCLGLLLLKIPLTGFSSLSVQNFGLPVEPSLSAGGFEWENSMQVTVNSSQPIVTVHLIFGNHAPQNCRGGIYVEARENNTIGFNTSNEVNKNGVCTETDVIFDNIIYKEQPSFGISENQTAQQSIAYNIFYGKITAAAPAELEEQPIFKAQPNYGIASGTRYWVGGTGSWSDVMHWASSSGGSPGASKPTVGEAVIFDNNSGGGTATLDETGYAASLDVGTVTNNNTILALGAQVINVVGDFKWKSGNMSFGTSTVNLTGIGTITTAGYASVNRLYNLQCAASGQTTTIEGAGTYLAITHALVTGTGTTSTSDGATIGIWGYPTIFTNGGGTWNGGGYFNVQDGGLSSITWGNVGNWNVYYSGSSIVHTLGGALTTTGYLKIGNYGINGDALNLNGQTVSVGALYAGENGKFDNMTFGAATVTAASFTINANATASLNSSTTTVSGQTLVSGTLNASSSTCSFGSGVTTYESFWVNAATGNFIGGSGTHTMGSFVITAGTATFTTGTTIINGKYGASQPAIGNYYGSLNLNQGTVNFTYAGAGGIYMTGSTTFGIININNGGNSFPISSSAVYTMTAGTLNIISGIMNFSAGGGATHPALTVTGLTDVYGTLTTGAVTVSLGSGTGSTGGLKIRSGGVFTGGTGSHTIGGSYLMTGGTWNATSGTTTIDGEMPYAGYVLGLNTGTFYHNNGKVNITYCSSKAISTKMSNPLYDFIISCPSGQTVILSGSPNGLNVTNSLTVGSGTFGVNTITSAIYGTTTINGTLLPTTGTFTFNGAVTINSGGTLGANTAYTFDINNVLTVNSGGTLSAPSATGTFTISSSFILEGTFTHNSGTITFDGSSDKTFGANGAVTPTFNNIAATMGGVYYFLRIRFASLTILNNLTISHGTSVNIQAYTYGASQRNTILTMGTASNSGNISGATSYTAFQGDTSTAGSVTVQAASASYPILISNVGYGAAMSGTNTYTMKDVTFTSAQTTAGAITLAGTATFNGTLTIPSGSTLGSNTAYTLDVNAALTVNGTLSAPNATGNWYQSANVIFNSGSTLTHNSGTYTADGNHTFGSFPSENTHHLYNLVIADGKNWGGVAYRQPYIDKNITIGTTAGAVLTIGANYQYFNGEVIPNPASTITTGGSLVFDKQTVTLPAFNGWGKCIFWSNSYTLGGNSTFDTISMYTWNPSVTLAVGSYSLTVNTLLNLAPAATGSAILTVGAGGNITVNGTINIANLASTSFGSNTNYILDINGNLTNAKTFNAPNSTGTFTFSGGALNNSGTFNHDSGTIIFDKSGTTAISGTITFNNVNITSTATANLTSATQITTAGTTTLSGALQITNGTWTNLTLNDGTNTTQTIKGLNAQVLNTLSAPANPSGFRNVTKYSNLTNTSGSGAYAFLNISYLDSDLPAGLNESSLRISKYTTSWNTNPSTFANIYNVNTSANVVYANITDFGSIFAPLGKSAPDAPTLLSPASDSLISTTRTPTLNFTIPGDVDNDTLHFEVWVSDQPDFSTTTEFGNSSADAAPFTPTPPVLQNSGNMSYQTSTKLNATIYYWQVRAFDGYSYSSYSSTFNFTVDSIILDCNLGTANVTFGEVQIGTTNAATGNTLGAGGGTIYNVTADASIATNVTIKGTNMTCQSGGCGANIMPVSQTKWSSSESSATDGAMCYANGSAMQETDDNVHKIADFLPQDATAWERYWLDVPPAQPPGTYNGNYTITCVAA